MDLLSQEVSRRFTAAQLPQTSFLTGTTGDDLQVRAFDGFTWSAAQNASWSAFHITTS